MIVLLSEFDTYAEGESSLSRPTTHHQAHISAGIFHNDIHNLKTQRMGEYVKNRSITLVDGTILLTVHSKGVGVLFGLGLYYARPLICFQSKINNVFKSWFTKYLTNKKTILTSMTLFYEFIFSYNLWGRWKNIYLSCCPWWRT